MNNAKVSHSINNPSDNGLQPLVKKSNNKFKTK